MSKEYSLEITSAVFEQMTSMSERQFSKVYQSIDNLRFFPEMGRVYEPQFETSMPPAGCRMLAIPGTVWGAFYLLSKEEKKVIVFLVSDMRRDPLMRFVGLHLTKK